MSIATGAVPFEISGDLPRGVTVLEASAGTGKTYTIAALAARFVAEGTPIDQLLLITFTRLATGELRDRVRRRMAEVHDGLGGDDPAAHRDEVVRLLAEGSPEVVAQRRRNLARALASFDAATVETTHAFCQLVLRGLGVVSDAEAGATLVEDVRDLATEVIDDLYLRLCSRGHEPPFSRGEALEIGMAAAIRHPAVELAAAGTEGVAQRRVRLAEAVREELARRKRARGILTYDDLLTVLRDAVCGSSGDVVVARLRDHHRVVLVDEFQDTDPVQWEIVERAFGDGERPLVLIGDPKQAIYAFRGADVYAYLRAAARSETLRTLRTNWRSDADLIAANEALFGGARLGHPDIVSRPVDAAEENRARRLAGAPENAPMRVRALHPDEPGLVCGRNGAILVDSAREHIAKDCAADIVALLDSQATVESEEVQPGHIAVLARKHAMARAVRDELLAAGVPAVITGAGSVFATGPADEWLTLLRAMDRPTSRTSASAAALTCFFGWSAERIAAAGDEEWETVHRRLHQWSRVLRVKGVAALLERITLTEHLPARMLATLDGERRLTDLRHVGQLLHAAAMAEHLGPTALMTWLRRRIDEAGQDLGSDELTRRLETDADAVQVLTIHTSKGLEFPIVYCPDVWEASWNPSNPATVAFHDPDDDDAWKLDVAREGDAYDAHTEQEIVEQRGEDLRLLYVALTRARHQVVLWWAHSTNTYRGPLSRLLCDRAADGTIDPDGDAGRSCEEVLARFAEVSTASGRRLVVERSSLAAPAAWGAPPRDEHDLVAATFDRRLDWAWRRLSFSAITAGVYGARVGSEHEEAVLTDEDDAAEPVRAPTGPESGLDLRAVPSLLADMPVGRHVGTLVHQAFERVDFAASDLEAELRDAIDEAQAWRRVDLGPDDDAVAGLAAALRTPLGPLAGNLSLAAIPRSDRLDELTFELPLVGGDDPDGTLALRDIAAALREHLPDDDPLAGYAERLDDPELTHQLRGYLTGSIDLLARLPAAGGRARYAVLDYKTNWLAPEDEDLTAWHHRPESLTAEMLHGHYGLQALLYAVATHRFLRWRDPAYDPDESFAGVLYLFVRGMTGPDTPVVDGTPCGVFGWRPPGALLTALSDLLDRGGAS